jgi:ABC-type polysaccharide transport system permease subunit
MKNCELICGFFFRLVNHANRLFTEVMEDTVYRGYFSTYGICSTPCLNIFKAIVANVFLSLMLIL